MSKEQNRSGKQDNRIFCKEIVKISRENEERWEKEKEEFESVLRELEEKY